MNSEQIADAIDRCFVSPNVADSNLEPANLVDVVDKAAHGLFRIAHAIYPPNTAPGHTKDGGTVASLTEAMMGVADGLHRISLSISDLAEAVREQKGQDQ